jgi:hypothetical protein
MDYREYVGNKTALRHFDERMKEGADPKEALRSALRLCIDYEDEEGAAADGIPGAKRLTVAMVRDLFGLPD